MQRVILHSDANSFYASVEVLYHPELRGKPVAVCGDPEARHGIVLTKTPEAKRCGVKTAMAVWQARQVCPDLIVVPPDYRHYVHFSKLLQKIYAGLSDHVEPFGLDESWLDLSGQGRDMEYGRRAADALRARVREELGITVSVGVSFNKVFAKLGSDMKKPDGTTVISPENFRRKVWPLDVQELLFVGPHTRRKLERAGIHTVGALANADSSALHALLGKNGLTLRAFARGEDRSPVALLETEDAPKSISNSTTPPHDIENAQDARCIYYLLAESVGARLRRKGLRAQVVSVSARTTALETFSCQCAVSPATNLTGEIAEAAMTLFSQRFAKLLPLRSVGLCCTDLTADEAPLQIDMLGGAQRRMHTETLERSVDALRDRFGRQVIHRGIVLADREFAQITPAEDQLARPFNMSVTEGGR